MTPVTHERPTGGVATASFSRSWLAPFVTAVASVRGADQHNSAILHIPCASIFLAAEK